MMNRLLTRQKSFISVAFSIYFLSLYIISLLRIRLVLAMPLHHFRSHDCHHPSFFI